MKEFMYVMNFLNEEIYKIAVTDNDNSTEDILREKGMNINSCIVMFSNKDIKIQEL